MANIFYKQVNVLPSPLETISIVYKKERMYISKGNVVVKFICFNLPPTATPPMTVVDIISHDREFMCSKKNASMNDLID